MSLCLFYKIIYYTFYILIFAIYIQANFLRSSRVAVAKNFDI